MGRTTFQGDGTFDARKAMAATSSLPPARIGASSAHGSPKCGARPWRIARMPSLPYAETIVSMAAAIPAASGPVCTVCGGAISDGGGGVTLGGAGDGGGAGTGATVGGGFGNSPWAAELTICSTPSTRTEMDVNVHPMGG